MRSRSDSTRRSWASLQARAETWSDGRARVVATLGPEQVLDDPEHEPREDQDDDHRDEEDPHAPLLAPCSLRVGVLAAGDVRRVEAAGASLDRSRRVVCLRVRRRSAGHQPPVIGDGSGTTVTDDAPRATVMRRPVVTAPSLADDTSAAYLAITPPRYCGGGACHDARRSASTHSGTSRSRRRAVTSIEISSPSSTRPIGPPSAASGATCPIISPWVPPEKRPSVSSATDSPRPSPTSAAVTLSISCMPGPPTGPS